MVHLDLQEQEQLSQLSYFWHSFGKYLALLLLLMIAIYVGDTVWNAHKKQQAYQASELYAQLLTKQTIAVSPTTESASINLTKQLQSDYPSTEYATMASLIIAKDMYQQHNLPEAANLLNWVINNSTDNGLVDIARLRIADVYIDEKQFKLALAVLMHKHDPVFDPLYYIKRGDLYVAEGNLMRAHDAYEEALQKAGNDSDLEGTIKLRLVLTS